MVCTFPDGAALRSVHFAIESAELLIEAGADLNVTEPQYGFTPLQTAIFNGHYDLAARLVEKVAHRTAPNHNFLAAQRAGPLRERFPNRRRRAAVDGDYLHADAKS